MEGRAKAVLDQTLKVLRNKYHPGEFGKPRGMMPAVTKKNFFNFEGNGFRQDDFICVSDTLIGGCSTAKQLFVKRYA